MAALGTRLSFSPFHYESLLRKVYRRGTRTHCHKGAVIFKSGYRGGRIFGGVPNYSASCNWGIKTFGKNYKIYDGL